jgi:hypothetical protein
VIGWRPIFRVAESSVTFFLPVYLMNRSRLARGIYLSISMVPYGGAKPNARCFLLDKDKTA